MNPYYPFSKKTEYFNKEQLQKVNDFLAHEPRENTVYTHSSGEMRHVLYVKLPSGTIDKTTTWWTNQSDGSRWYMTERATLTSREPLVAYYDKDKKMLSCTGSEWMEWYDGVRKENEAPKDKREDPYAAGRKLILARAENEKIQFEKEAIAEKKEKVARGKSK